MVVNPNSQNWYTAEQVGEILDVSDRTLRTRLTDVRESLVRQDAPSGRGRPRSLYHYTALPELTAHHETRVAQDEPTDEAMMVVAPDDARIARLRMQAVKQYDELSKLISREEAAKAVCTDWRKRPRRDSCKVEERLPGGHTRKRVKYIELPAFRPATLRSWAYVYREKGILGLVPQRKGKTGRKKTDIPDELLGLVHALSVSTSRASILAGVEKAKPHWPDRWPEVSDRTWLRRIRERDPERVCETLGKLGIAAFRTKHSPDIERDYSSLRYNQLWQIDDVEEDFYGHANDPLRLIRPKVYATIRVATRQWICAVACETPITQAQVHSLMGLGMASSHGGIPEEMSFENGTVACDDYLYGLMTDLGVVVHKTSMNSGKVHADAPADRAKGHPQGKAVCERGMRGHHDLCWDMPAGTGTEERHTAHANLETLKAEAIRRAKKGEPLILPSPAQWQAIIHQRFQAHNNRPHSSLPQIIDEDGKRRHMSPNEYAVHLGEQKIKVMDEALLPLFFEKTVEVTVTKNGFRINGFSYGRFDNGLQDLAGQTVRVCAIKEQPDIAYVVELGRVVERFVKPQYGREGDLIARKRGIEKKKRNQYETLVADAIESGGSVILETMRFTSNPTPNRPTESVGPEQLLQFARDRKLAIEQHREQEAAHRSKFEFEGSSRSRGTTRKRRKSLLSAADRLGDSVTVMNNSTDEEDAWND